MRFNYWFMSLLPVTSTQTHNYYSLHRRMQSIYNLYHYNYSFSVAFYLCILTNSYKFKKITVCMDLFTKKCTRKIYALSDRQHVQLGIFVGQIKRHWGNYMCLVFIIWWRHQMEKISALLALGAGNSPVTGEFPAQRPVTQSFDIFLDLRLNKRLSKQWWGCWFEKPSRPLWRHCNYVYHLLDNQPHYLTLGCKYHC